MQNFPRSLLLTLTIGAALCQPVAAQDPEACRSPQAACEGFDRYRLTPSNSPTWAPQMIRPSGRPIVPVFEGWFENPDGTFTLSFGYISMNLEEAVHIPLGPDNFIEPREFDGGQPTYFKEIHRVIRRPWNSFMVTVPADFGDKRIVWTLRDGGQTYSVPGHITRRDYIIETPVAPARAATGTAGAYAPMMRFDGSRPWAHGLAGTRWGPLNATVGRPLEIPVHVNKGETLNDSGESWLYWMLYSGPGDVSFSEDEVRIELNDEGEGTGTTRVTFAVPGRYVLLVQAIETLRNSFEYHCCWTNGWVEIDVTN